MKKQELYRPEAGTRTTLVQKYGKHIFSQRFKLHSGKWTDYLLMEIDRPPAVVTIPVTYNGNLVVIKQFRYGANDFIFEFPGGCLEPNQTPIECAAKELRQETGYGHKEIRPLSGHIFFEPASNRTPYQVFLSTGCVKEGEPELDEEESLEVSVISFDQWLEMITHGLVKSSWAIVATTLYFMDSLRWR